ncbi:MAG: YfhO family protein [Acidobacteriota bacterium]
MHIKKTDFVAMFKRHQRQFIWLMVAMVPALYALKGVFSLSSVFFVRDLGSYFYPHHLWIRRAVLAGELPLWNPDSGSGYATVADPSLQLFFLPTLPFRFLLPESVGFNFMVVFPFVCAAIGTFVFLKRRVSLQSAALGSIVFSISGPLLSSANSLNPSTTAALIPWLLLATDKLIESYSRLKLCALGGLFALGVFAGQPDILIWEVLLVLFYAAFSQAGNLKDWRALLKREGLVIGSGGLGLLLSAVQILPLLDVMRRSHRASGAMLDGWSIHPLNLFEMMMPGIFSSPLIPSSHLHPWLYQLNSGREPYLMSIYLGITTLIVALVGVARGEPRRWTKFWAFAFLVAGFLALGNFTPVYSGLRVIFPLLNFFRYPAKLTIFMAFAVAMLAALGFDAIKVLTERLATGIKIWRVPVGFAAIITVFAATLTVLSIGFPDITGQLLNVVATRLGLNQTTGALSDMVAELKQAAPRLLGLASCSVLLLLIGVSQKSRATLARVALFAVIVFDLLITNASINPTIELSQIREPDWVAAVRQHPTARIFVDDQSGISPAPVSAQFNFYLPPDMSLSMADALYHKEIPYNAIKYGLRDAVIVDVTKLRAAEYTQLIKLFRAKDGESRTRFLQRTGVRYFLQPEPPAGQFRLIQPVPIFATDKMALYECPNALARVSVVQEAEIEPNLTAQFDKLFTADFDAAKTVLLDKTPPAAVGIANEANAASATIIEDGNSHLSIRASAPEGGAYLLLRDSYDPNWQVEVDGASAPLLRANGLYRAVRFAQGEHTIRFTYRPTPLFYGAAISLLTALLLTVLVWREWRKAKVTDASITKENPVIAEPEPVFTRQASE